MHRPKVRQGTLCVTGDNEVFKLYYFALIKYFEPLLSVSRKEKISFENFYAFDSTTITLFSDVMKGVDRNPRWQEKGGLESTQADRCTRGHGSIYQNQRGKNAR